MNTFIDLLKDSLADSIKLLPFLFVTYLAMELLEHHAGSKSAEAIHKAGPVGPIIGGILGILPQCGFSAAASSLYAGRIIGIGTLTAVFFSTSDEMLPILISSSVPVHSVMKILALKAVLAVISGYIAAFIFKLLFGNRADEPDIHTVCEEEHCGCDEGIFHSALVHTLKITVYIFIITFLLSGITECIGSEHIELFFRNHRALPEFVTALIGLIPNCASSVAITKLYVDGIIGSGALLSGLLVNAGVGMLVLLKLNRRPLENTAIIIMLYLMSVFWGIIINTANIVF